MFDTESHPQWNERDTNPLRRQVQLFENPIHFSGFKNTFQLRPFDQMFGGQTKIMLWPEQTGDNRQTLLTDRQTIRPSKWFSNHRCSNTPHLSVKPTGTLHTVTYHLPVLPYKLPQEGARGRAEEEGKFFIILVGKVSTTCRLGMFLNVFY